MYVYATLYEVVVYIKQQNTHTFVRTCVCVYNVHIHIGVVILYVVIHTPRVTRSHCSRTWIYWVLVMMIC